jgi:hypothetical protein
MVPGNLARPTKARNERSELGALEERGEHEVGDRENARPDDARKSPRERRAARRVGD